MKYQILALCLASSLFSCRNRDDGPRKSEVVNVEQIQGYWSPAASVAQLKNIESAVDVPLLSIKGTNLSTASKSNPLFQCPDERVFSIEANTIRIEKTEACPEQIIQVLSRDASSISFAMGSETFQFRKAHESVAEIIINSAFDDISGLSSSLKALYQAPPTRQDVDAYISALQVDLQNLKLVVPDTSVFARDGFVSTGAQVGNGLSGGEKSLSCTIISQQEWQTDGYEKALNRAVVDLPRKENNRWDFVVTPDIESLRAAGLNEEEITNVLNRPRQGSFSNRHWRGNHIQLVNDDFAIFCSQPFSLGFITLSQIRETLGTLALLKSDR